MVPDRTRPTDAPTGRRTALVLALAGCLALAGAAAAAAPAAAATTTELSLVPADGTTAAPGESLTYEVVVGTVDDGVGSYIVDVTVSDASVATIQNASDRTGGNERVEVADDGASVRIGAFAGDTVDSGSDVVVATVTVTGERAGTADVDLAPSSVSDERGGDGYTIDDVGDATVTVEGDGSGTPDGATPTPDDADGTTPDDDGTPTASPTPTPDDDGTTPDDGSPATDDADGTPGADDATPGTDDDSPTASAATSGGAGTTTTGSPGFGPAVAVLALLGAALIARRRRD